MYADIIIDISHEQLDKTFQYSIPEELEPQIKPGVCVNVPFGKGNKMISGFVISLSETPKFDVEKIKPVICVQKGRVAAIERMIELAAWLKKNYGGTMNQALKMVLPVKEKVAKKEQKNVVLLLSEEETKKQLEVYEKKNATARYRLLLELQKTPVIDCDLIKDKLHITMQTIRAMQEAGVVNIDSKQVYRNPVKTVCGEQKQLILSDEQQLIKDTFISDYEKNDYKTYLIHGITGSGKTLCYMELIDYVIAQNRQVIVLIPEIALTYQTVLRFYSRFGNQVSILNSRMSKGERYDQLLRAMRGEINIMIGPRSALFTPFSNLGLIVIDEEHEGAYKSEQSPKFHARETAEHIAKMCGASLVLGSATPSMESYYRAMCGEYKLFTLTNRAAGGSLPTVYTEDLREELKSGNRSIFSRKLQKLISDRLQKKEQIMLFLNKRGYAGFISCRMCGHVLKCPHCDISMTIHRGGTMVCHYCGYSQPQVRVCPECGSKYISGFKAGTQQVEDMVKKMYPDAKVLRMDMDTTSGKEGHEKILSAFSNREADILIGTQMIVKGHDFPDVTLVGILAADMSLYAGDYRAAERTFQLLTQAAGRAGRGEKKGEVVIQTYTPDNYSIQTAAKQDYKGFYEEEIAYRQLLGYPPVSNMLMITFASKNEERLNIVSEKMKKKIALIHEEDVSILGPVDAQVYKLNDYYNRLVYVRSGSYEKLTIFKDWLEGYALENPLFKDINIQYEFN